MTNMTKREMYEVIANAMSDNAEVVEFCNHEVELLDKKKARKSDKPTAKQIENEEIKSQIVEILTHTEAPVTATEIKDELNGGYTIQRVSSLLSQLVKTEKVIKTYSKKVALFSIA